MNWDTSHTQRISEKYVYRYISFEKLIDFLKTGSLWFARMDTFEDNLEGFSPLEISELMLMFQKIPFEFRKGELWEEWSQKRKLKLQSIREKLIPVQASNFVNCWILGNTESIGMWDLYGRNGFCIRFKRKVLQNLIKSRIKFQTETFSPSDLLVAGKVNYQDYEQMIWNEKENLLKYAGFRKHIAFKHEDEYRIIIRSKSIKELGIYYSLGKIEIVKFNILASPRMKEYQRITYQDIIWKYQPKLELEESKLKPWLEFKNMEF